MQARALPTPSIEGIMDGVPGSAEKQAWRVGACWVLEGGVVRRHLGDWGMEG
jgi:hypothetical protein